MDFMTFQNMVQNQNSQEGISARFYDKAVKTGEVNKNGLPVFVNRCFVEIRIKDNNSEIFDQPASAEKIRQFPIEYARYQLGRKQIEKGTPLEQFAFLTAAEIESLKVRGIFTVEALVELEKDKVEQLELEKEQNLAKKFMAQAKNNKMLQQWQQKEENYIAEIQSLKEQLQELKNNSVVKPAVRRKK